MSSPTLSRRTLITGTAAAVASAALAVPALHAVRADEVCSLPLTEEAEEPGRYPVVLHTAVGMRGLIRAHQQAHARYEYLFDENDWGRATDAEVSEALGLVNDTLEAICRARPLNSEAAELRRDYVSPILVEFTDCCPALMQCMYDALLA